VSGEIPPAIGDFPPGAQIASYRIEELIGRGGMAAVYRAIDVRLDRLVALKVLAPELGRDERFRQRFIRESRSGAAVDHPNVIPVFEAGEADGHLFIAMRYVTGQDVRALIEREHKLPVARAMNIVTQVASALDAAHAHGLIHRDVKPANMLLAAEGDGRTPDHIYLSDFGLSKLSVGTSSLTGTGQFLGTLDYMSPEQVEGRPVDGRTDLYALACAAFEMLAGEPPFHREQNLAVMWAQVSAPPPSVLRWRPELPPAVDQVLAKALAKVPADRHGSCMEFASALRGACAIRPGGKAAADRTAQAAPATKLAGAAAVGAGGAATADAPSAFPPTVGFTPAGAGRGAGVAEAAGEQTISHAVTGAPRRTDYGRAPSYPPPEPPPGQWPGQPPSGPAAYGKPPRRRSRRFAIVLGIVVLAAMGGAAAIVLHLRSGPGTPVGGGTTTITITPSSTPSSGTTPTSPTDVVNAFFNALNARDYPTAWRLDQYVHSTETYAQFKHGYITTTQHDTVTITGTNGNSLTIHLTALQTDGTYKYYTGTETVRNGTIVYSHIVPTNS